MILEVFLHVFYKFKGRKFWVTEVIYAADMLSFYSPISRNKKPFIIPPEEPILNILFIH